MYACVLQCHTLLSRLYRYNCRVYVCVCMYVCDCISVFVFMSVCGCVSLSVCLSVSTYLCMRMFVCKHSVVCVFAYQRLRACSSVSVLHLHVYANEYTCIDMQTQTMHSGIHGGCLLVDSVLVYMTNT